MINTIIFILTIIGILTIIIISYYNKKQKLKNKMLTKKKVQKNKNGTVRVYSGSTNNYQDYSTYFIYSNSSDYDSSTTVESVNHFDGFSGGGSGFDGGGASSSWSFSDSPSSYSDNSSSYSDTSSDSSGGDSGGSSD